MFDKIRNTVKQFGYEEYDAPLIEPVELYLAKSGEEIVSDQTYSFVDRGGRQVAIRPEMTPSVSRMVAAKRQQLVYPLRWFSIPNLWRYERPQRGRFREHWQLNVDLFGIDNLNAEIEIISVADGVIRAFGADQSMYEIRINHRELLNQTLLKYLGLNLEQSFKISHLIDKKAKLGITDFVRQVDLILNSKQKVHSVTEKLIAVLDAKTINDLPDELKSTQSVKELSQLFNSLNQIGINNISFDMSVVRGFDYYTGIVFEIFDLNTENNRSMMGGGRYDGLVGLFGVPPLPTVGFGLGDATLANFIELHGLKPDFKNITDVYVAVIGGNLIAAYQLAKSLRDYNLNVEVDLSGNKLSHQLKTASKKGLRFVVIVGEKETASKIFTFRDLLLSKEYSYSLKQITENLLNQNG
jgi:histidyl-tRNA synthetase